MSIRIFGVGLLAVAAVAGAALYWKRRRGLMVYGLDPARRRLENLRTAGL